MPKTCAYARHVRHIAAALSRRYGNWSHYNRKNPLEELLFIICSIQTNEDLYRRTFGALRRAFPTFGSLERAPKEDIARAIVDGGLSNQKADKNCSPMRAITTMRRWNGTSSSPDLFHAST